MGTVEVRVRGEWSDALDDYGHDPRIEEDRALFHWAPTARRKQILRHGLRPSQRPTLTSEFRAPYVCFADSPSWAWGLSGDMKWAPSGAWDLWQTELSALGDGVVLVPSSTRDSGIHEVRTPNRVRKGMIWYVGSRMKP